MRTILMSVALLCLTATAAAEDKPIRTTDQELLQEIKALKLRIAELEKRIAKMEMEGMRPGNEPVAATISLARKVYQPDEEITLKFQIKNVSDKPLYVGDGFLAPAYHEAGYMRHFDVLLTAEEETHLRFWSGLSTKCESIGCRKVFRLNPGQSYDGSIRLSAGRENDKNFASRPHEDRGGSFEAISARKPHVLGVDGKKYSLVLFVVRSGSFNSPSFRITSCFSTVVVMRARTTSASPVSITTRAGRFLFAPPPENG
jgi:hypothetical protein